MTRAFADAVWIRAHPSAFALMDAMVGKPIAMRTSRLVRQLARRGWIQHRSGLARLTPQGVHCLLVAHEVIPIEASIAAVRRGRRHPTPRKQSRLRVKHTI